MFVFQKFILRWWNSSYFQNSKCAKNYMNSYTCFLEMETWRRHTLFGYFWTKYVVAFLTFCGLWALTSHILRTFLNYLPKLTLSESKRKIVLEIYDVLKKVWHTWFYFLTTIFLLGFSTWTFLRCWSLSCSRRRELQNFAI